MTPTDAELEAWKCAGCGKPADMQLMTDCDCATKCLVDGKGKSIWKGRIDPENARIEANAQRIAELEARIAVVKTVLTQRKTWGEPDDPSWGAGYNAALDQVTAALTPPEDQPEIDHCGWVEEPDDG